MKLFEKHCWAEIDLDALRHNYKEVAKMAGSTPICGVVKADAYGHGDLMVARTLSDCGAQWFAVSSLREGVRLRKGGITQPILVLGYSDPALAVEMHSYNLTLALPSLDWAKAASKAAVEAGVTLDCQLKLDTGMGRIGFCLRGDLARERQAILESARLPGLHITGAFQHFSAADSTQDSDRAYTDTQKMLFDMAVKELRDRGLSLETVHCCNSAAQALHPEWQYSMVRAGIILYGCNPSPQVPLPQLRQVMTLKSVITHIKTVEPGRYISYGRTYQSPIHGRIATLAAGYADGYPRLLSNLGLVTIRGVAAPVVGRVCMDQLMVDVTHIPDAALGDEVVLFGPNQAGDDVEAVAAKTGLITYEVLSQVNRRVPRVYLEGGKVTEVLDYLDPTL